MRLVVNRAALMIQAAESALWINQPGGSITLVEDDALALCGLLWSARDPVLPEFLHGLTEYAPFPSPLNLGILPVSCKEGSP